MSTDTKSLTAFTMRELRLCVRANQIACGTQLALFFAMISRLGNGVFWYTLILGLPIPFGMAALPASLHIALTAISTAFIYWSLKGMIRRPRPYHHHRAIRIQVPPLDEFSFPSGHTLQAVSMTIVATAWYPVLAWILVPFAGLVALSRVVLGLHYPSDVAAAALIGSVIGVASLGLYAVIV